MKLPVDNNKINEMINLALETSMAGEGGPFSSMIIESGSLNVVAIASNSVLKDKDPTAHGEINAIRKACKILNKENLEGYSLITSNEPCPMCMSAIMWARLDNWYYIADSATAAQIGFDDVEFYKRLQLIMRMKKVPSEYKKLFRFDNEEAYLKIKASFQEYTSKNKNLY